ncbi:TadE/TadG family type IV pilus assembly protein [Sphingobium estronivorans]|uniref:TadE/TadG family type IV pilus assembly protein n=1 Tax=Sphingobium estronivorans TaxID=1577690 RepID=UPI003B84988F
MMKRLFPRFRRAASAIGKDESGLAVIEFAYSLPILMALSLGGLETANLAMTHMRISQVAMLVADNASRVRTSIDQADVKELFAGAEISAASVKNFKANAKIYLTELEPNGKAAPNTGQFIRWQCNWGSGSFTSTYGATGNGQNDATLVNGIGPTDNKITAGSGTAVMFVEVAYTYQPLVSNSIFGPKTIHYTSAFNVRERTDQSLKNASGIANLCTTV